MLLTFPELNMLLNLYMQFVLLSVVPKYFHTLSSQGPCNILKHTDFSIISPLLKPKVGR